MSNHAAIDIGTNSVHLLVAEVGEGGEFSVLTTEKETVRLGDSPGDIRNLAADAMDRGVRALKRFKAIADSFDATLYAVATSAVREADNGPEFVRRAADAGVQVDVIAGTEEARLIHLGILQALPVFEQQLVMVDIGGGSTEILVGKSGRALGARSLRIGHLRLTNRFFPGGVIDPASIEACRAYTRAFLVPAVSALRPLGFQVAVGSSGTAEALGDMIRLRSHGDAVGAGIDTVITAAGLSSILDELTQWATPAERSANVAGLADKRADVIVGGAILLQEIFLAFGIVRMAEAFEEDQPHVQHATDLALGLFDQLAPLHGLGPADRELLEAAGLLHNVGLFVSHAAHHQHSEYIIRNSDRLLGYTEREVNVVAQVARYHRRSAPKASHSRFMELAESDQQTVRWLAGMLRIAIALDRTRGSVVTAVDVHDDGSILKIVPQHGAGADVSVEVFTANERSSLLGKISERNVVIEA